MDTGILMMNVIMMVLYISMQCGMAEKKYLIMLLNMVRILKLHSEKLVEIEE